MLHDGHIWLRVGTRLARELGQSYATLRRAVTAGTTGFTVHTVTMRNGHQQWYLRLDEVTRALGRGYRKKDTGEDAIHGSE